MPFSPRWFSHKFNGPGLRYEIAVSLSSGQIVWAHGPFPCGAYPDIKILKEKLLNFLLPEERLIADNGYPHARCITPGNCTLQQKEYVRLTRARHETVNERLKIFSSIRNVFRYNLNLHGYVFHAVVKLTALMLDTTDPLFSVENDC